MVLPAKIVVITLRGTERDITVDEGAGVAELCVELVFLPNAEFPIEINLLINVSTQESKNNCKVQVYYYVSCVIVNFRFCSGWL